MPPDAVSTDPVLRDPRVLTLDALEPLPWDQTISDGLSHSSSAFKDAEAFSGMRMQASLPVFIWCVGW